MTQSAAMGVRDLLEKAGYNVTLQFTPFEDEVIAVLDNPSPYVLLQGNERFFSIKTKSKSVQGGYERLKEIERYLSQFRNILINNEYYAHFIKLGEPELGGQEEGLKGKYFYIYQAYRTFKMEEKP
jgi:hypothetical protein